MTAKRPRNAKVVTLCDFGTEGRRDVMRVSYTLKAALNAYQWYWNIYHRIWRSKIWQEDVTGGHTCDQYLVSKGPPENRRWLCAVCKEEYTLPPIKAGLHRGGS